MLDMAEGGAAEGEDGRADLWVADDLDAEHVGEARAAVVAEGPEDQVLALLVEYEDPGQHRGESRAEEEGRGDDVRIVVSLAAPVD